MDVVKAVLFGAGAYVVMNVVLSLTVGGTVSFLYLLPPLLAGIVASAYHAQFGRGGWPRHLLAVLIGPVLIAGYIVLTRYLQTGQASLVNAGGGLLVTAIAALLGMGIVMGVRFLLGFRTQTQSEAEPQERGAVSEPRTSPRALARAAAARVDTDSRSR